MRTYVPRERDLCRLPVIIKHVSDAQIETEVLPFFCGTLSRATLGGQYAQTT